MSYGQGQGQGQRQQHKATAAVSNTTRATAQRPRAKDQPRAPNGSRQTGQPPQKESRKARVAQDGRKPLNGHAPAYVANSVPAIQTRLSRTKKRIIVCCDGTWMNSEIGYVKTGIFKKRGTLQVPSNVTRISRCFKRTCSDGTNQIISYTSGVGTGMFDSITGGAFGLGLSERVCEAYSYLCANYHSGDEIVLVGFSRGAFTARSVAGMVSNLGLLTRQGLDHFYPVFRDMQHWGDDDYQDPFPDVPFPDKPNTEEAYRYRLEKMGLTRVRQANGNLIKIKAVCVWDTVGSLGIPRVSWLDTLGLKPPFYDEYKWHDTALSDRIEHAFQALALDETRPPFGPAVWERLEENRLTTDLRQVWFPGNHGNIGGGWDDQGMADITLAWMMDQMASVGVEFDKPSLDRIFRQSMQYYEKLEAPTSIPEKSPFKKITRGLNPVRWAIDPVFSNNRPFRPWGLGAIRSTSSIIYKLSGKTIRRPSQYKQTDARTGVEKSSFLRDTNERVHSSVRVRLACKGLDLNDEGTWTCPALSGWQLKRTTSRYDDPVPHHPYWEPGHEEQTPVEEPNRTGGGRWVWEYVGKEEYAPTDLNARTLVEEPLGPYERYLLKMSGGAPNVYEFASKAWEHWELSRLDRYRRRLG